MSEQLASHLPLWYTASIKKFQHGDMLWFGLMILYLWHIEIKIFENSWKTLSPAHRIL